MNDGAVTLFENSDCSGLSTRIYRDSSNDEDALLTSSDLQQGDNFLLSTIGSVMLPPGYQLVTYTDGQFNV